MKIGRQTADQDFIVSQNATYFINTGFGWPVLPSVDVPGGGPAYPLSAPAIRLRLHPNDAITFLTGVFSGSPVGDNSGDPQRRKASGTSFPPNRGALVISEL